MGETFASVAKKSRQWAPTDDDADDDGRHSALKAFGCPGIGCRPAPSVSLIRSYAVHDTNLCVPFQVLASRSERCGRTDYETNRKKHTRTHKHSPILYECHEFRSPKIHFRATRSVREHLPVQFVCTHSTVLTVSLAGDMLLANECWWMWSAANRRATSGCSSGAKRSCVTSLQHCMYR